MKKLRSTYNFSDIIGNNRELKNVMETIAEVADTQANILIQGESGTGKELEAQAIHRNSSRRGKSFVTVNAGVIPDSLLESELFGYEKGAFTGAVTAKPGKFELANGGTLFLDEIGDMSILLQAKLLRAIQDREIEHLGGTQPAQGFSVMTTSTIEEAVQISKRTSLGLMICDMGSMAELTEKLLMLREFFTDAD